MEAFINKNSRVGAGLIQIIRKSTQYLVKPAPTRVRIQMKVKRLADEEMGLRPLPNWQFGGQIP
ncbi:MAG: hypothetical protein PUP93_20270 [Rhizonema sp. NSF051]|nr:hypothetical protein [Rhizonema sp. NSF051]